MLKMSRSLLFLLLVNFCLICGCGDGSTPITSTKFPVVVFSDVHFNPFYDKSLSMRLTPRMPAGGRVFSRIRASQRLRNGAVTPTTLCLCWHSPAYIRTWERVRLLFLPATFSAITLRKRIMNFPGSQAFQLMQTLPP